MVLRFLYYVFLYGPYEGLYAHWYHGSLDFDQFLLGLFQSIPILVLLYIPYGWLGSLREKQRIAALEESAWAEVKALRIELDTLQLSLERAQTMRAHELKWDWEHRNIRKNGKRGEYLKCLELEIYNLKSRIIPLSEELLSRSPDSMLECIRYKFMELSRREGLSEELTKTLPKLIAAVQAVRVLDSSKTR